MRQQGSKYFACRPPPPDHNWDGINWSKFNFSEHDHVAYQIKENQECSNMVANILPADHPPDPGDGVDRSKFNFFRTWSCCISEHGHVAYQFKGNHECSNMVRNVLPADPPPP